MDVNPGFPQPQTGQKPLSFQQQCEATISDFVKNIQGIHKQADVISQMSATLNSQHQANSRQNQIIGERLHSKLDQILANAKDADAILDQMLLKKRQN